MILVVGLNPAVDVVCRVQDPRIGQLNRAVEQAVYPAGKATNLAKYLALRGVEVALAGFIGRDDYGRFEALLSGAGVRWEPVILPGSTRMNFKVIDVASGDDTEFNSPGAPAPEAKLAELEELLRTNLTAASALVLTGGLPPSVPEDIYARWIELARQAGVPCALDASGAALIQAVQARPWLVKLNWFELSQLASRKIDTPSEAARVLRDLTGSGTELAAATRAEVAVLTTAHGQWKAAVPPCDVRNPIGAGDAFLGGLLVAWEQAASPRDMLRQAVASASASVTSMEPGAWSAEANEEVLPRIVAEPI